MKKVLFFLLTLLAASSVMAQNEIIIPSEMSNSEYVRQSRSQIYCAAEKKLSLNKVENFKKGMSRKELRRRNRSLAFQVAERIIEESVKPTGFEGVLKNYKRLPVQFKITRSDIRGTPNVSHLLGPEQKMIISLLPGIYQVELICYNESIVYPLEVRPGAANTFEGEKVYWFAFCNR